MPSPVNDPWFPSRRRRNIDTGDLPHRVSDSAVPESDNVTEEVGRGIAYRYINGEARIRVVLGVRVGPTDTEYFRLTYANARGNEVKGQAGRRSNATHIRTVDYDMQCVVLVPDIKVVDASKTISRGLSSEARSTRSMVWLEQFDRLALRFVDPLKLRRTALTGEVPSSLVPLPESSRIIEDRELSTFLAFLRRNGERVGEVIERSAKVEQRIAEDQSEVVRRFPVDVNLPDLLRAVTVRLDGERVNVVINEQVDHPIEFIQVSESAPELSSGAVEGAGHVSTLDRDDWSW